MTDSLPRKVAATVVFTASSYSAVYHEYITELLRQTETFFFPLQTISTSGINNITVAQFLLLSLSNLDRKYP